jgi:transposase
MQATNFSPGSISFSIPIHALGQPSKPRQYRSSSEGDSGAPYSIVEFFTDICLRAMELITILNRCHRFWGFVYHQARFTADKSIEISVRPRKRSAAICSRCHKPASAYDQLPERRFEFIPLWGFFASFCTPCDASIAAAATPSLSKKSPGAMANGP